jgi:hypothetical protein
VNKRLVVFAVVLAALLLSAVNPWPAILSVGNYTGANVYFTLKYHGVQEYFLTATPEGNSESWRISKFDIVRKTYSAKVTACDTTTTWGTMRLTRNLWLNFTPCDAMKQWWTPKYWGEPSMEKPNFFTDGSKEAAPPNSTKFGYWWYMSNAVQNHDLAGWDNYMFLYDTCTYSSCTHFKHYTLEYWP